MMKLSGEEKTLNVVPKCSALMGDGNAPEDFAQVYQPGIEKWRLKMKEVGLRKGTAAVCTFAGKSCDLGYSVFADDIAGT
eukprot:15583179-Heterocapsa_arctica.AAC.1